MIYYYIFIKRDKSKCRLCYVITGIFIYGFMVNGCVNGLIILENVLLFFGKIEDIFNVMFF